MTDSTSTPFPQTLLQRAHSPETAASHYTDRIHRPLLIRPSSPTPSARATRRKALNERKEKARKRNTTKPRPLSAAQKRKLGLNDIPKSQQKYGIYEPLHDLWLGYMREILGLPSTDAAGKGKVYVTPSSAGQMLASADMHGAKLRVVRSRCVSRVGVEGIVVRDTRGTFEVVTKGNMVKTVPKEHTIFAFEIPLAAVEGKDGEEGKPLRFEIMGEHFQTRAPDRANKKFRLHYQPGL
jgi:ribonuclease P protein subunit POP4